MSHLHIPDGVLPAWLWGGGLAFALVALWVSTRATRNESSRSVAWRGALGGLVLAAMAVELPLGPIEYHLSLVGPVGVLAGPAAAFQLVFVVSAILAFAGHGGFTVVGLNALVLGSGAVIARPTYSRLRMRFAPAAALALATGVSQGVSGLMWIAVVAVALRARPGAAGLGRVALLGGLALPLWLAGVLIECAVAFGLARFIARVRPDLLPTAAGIGALPADRGSASR
ncbi:MAG: energy-coupling factor ABC transporter permease [Candidatus Eisenbacteria bacterium]|nr:energy-coupling factor ABC transporter permease [Candidatus Eisenbacteria bacterium]